MTARNEPRVHARKSIVDGPARTLCGQTVVGIPVYRERCSLVAWKDEAVTCKSCRRIMDRNAAAMAEYRAAAAVAQAERDAVGRESRCACGDIKDPLHDKCMACAPPPPVGSMEDK